MLRDLLLPLLFFVASLCGLSQVDAGADQLTVLRPVPHQVVQRTGFLPGSSNEIPENRGCARLRVELSSSGSLSSQLQSQYRLIDVRPSSTEPAWRPFRMDYDPETRSVSGECLTTAGGWYRLEVRLRENSDQPWLMAQVEPVGVGEVFLVAGQSYATNTNDERMRVEDEFLRVAAFDTRSDTWQTAHDPQPAPDNSDGGSIWPALGDTLARRYGVPIGFANVAVGGTSSQQWQPGGDLLPRLIDAGRKLGRFRAVLWQQGESDVINGTSAQQYIQNLQTIRSTAVQAWGFEPVWLCAKSTHHPTVYSKPVEERTIREAIDALTLLQGFGVGPDTDVLQGEHRGGIGSRRHFTGLGQRKAAAMWADILTERLNRLPSGLEAASFLLADLHLLQPAWESDVVYRESTVLRIRQPNDVPVARLAFPAAEVLAIATADGTSELMLPPSAVSADGKTLAISGPIPVEPISDQQLYLPPDSPNSYRHRRDHPEQNLLYQPGHWFHDRNLEVTYRRADRVTSESTVGVVSGSLPASLEKLRKGQPLRIGISGDSISTGLDASLTTGTAPFQPGYPDLIVAQLRVLSASDVSLVNRSVAGWSVANGLQDLDALLAENPDLIIVAYGMNDVGRKDPKWFREQYEMLLGRIRAARPQTEILLVSTMLGNQEWIHTPREMFAEYRDVLKAFAAPGTAVADLTEVWARLLNSKADMDLTGNGLNHPNDFGHRLYAQAILKLLTSAAP
jgi:acyl-CoA thioesterase-1